MKKVFNYILFALLLSFLLPIVARAEGNRPTEKCECALPVGLYLVYQSEERLLRTNYGILVGGTDEEGYTYIIVNASDVQATREELQSMYSDYGITEDDYNDVHQMIKIGIGKDIFIEADINNVSSSLNLAVLKLSTAVYDHKGVLFNVDENSVSPAQEVYIVDAEGGYHTGYALNESIINGVKYVQFDSPMDWEQSGVPLYNADGEVLGMIQNSIDGVHKNALSSKEIVVVLKTLGIANDVADHSIVPVDKKSLISATDIAEKLDLSLYTEETASLMAEKIEEARSIIINDEATQEEVDLAQAMLLETQEELILKNNLSPLAIVFMIISGVLFLGIIIFVMVTIIRKKKEKKKERDRAELEAKKAPELSGPYVPSRNVDLNGMNVSFSPKAISNTGRSTIFSTPQSAKLSGSGELKTEKNNSVKLSSVEGFAPSSKVIRYNEEDTTVLSVVEDEILKEEVNLGYLVRKNDSFRIDLRKNPSIIGKSADKSDYVIENKAISRAHLSIELREGYIYVKDLGSLNGSKLNQEKMNPEEEIELKDSDEITIADVEFIYHK